MNARKAKPTQGEKGDKAAQSAEKKLARGNKKGTYDYPGLVARRGRREGA